MASNWYSLQHVPIGLYPEIEYRLAERIRHLWRMGIPVKTWMVDMEAKLILCELFSERFSEPTFVNAAKDIVGRSRRASGSKLTPLTFSGWLVGRRSEDDEDHVRVLCPRRETR